MVWIVTKNDGSIDSIWTTEAAATNRVGPLSSGMCKTCYHTDQIL